MTKIKFLEINIK